MHPINELIYKHEYEGSEVIIPLANENKDDDYKMALVYRYYTTANGVAWYKYVGVRKL